MVQQHRLKIEISSVTEPLALLEFSGYEEIANGFKFKVYFSADDPSFKISDLLGQSATMTLQKYTSESKVFNGVVGSIQFITSHYSRPFSNLYCAEIISWFEALKLTLDCQIFQNKTVPEIFTSYCKQLGFSDFNISALANTYEPLDYCTQYNESAYDFLKRLLSTYGIFYYFLFEENKHTMHLIDKINSLPHFQQDVMVINNNIDRYLDSSRWSHAVNFSNTCLSSNDYNPQSPKTNLQVKLTGDIDTEIISNSDFEAFSYPGNYQTADSGEALLELEKIRNTSQAEIISTNGNYLELNLPWTFTITKHDIPSETGDYLATKIVHSAKDHTFLKPSKICSKKLEERKRQLSDFEKNKKQRLREYIYSHPMQRVSTEGSDEKVTYIGRDIEPILQNNLLNNPDINFVFDESDIDILSYEHAIKNNDLELNHQKDDYLNTLYFIPKPANFLPNPKINKINISGVHPAIVVGPEGSEIHTDKYGRVKVKFYWDRKQTSDKNNSCYLPVAQFISGNTWGSQFIPRIGDEVLVSFLNGNPDKPVIIRSAYNSNNTEPFSLKTSDAISGIKTRSLNNEDKTAGHELSFDDTYQNEKVKIHSQGDLNIEVLNDYTQFTHGDETVTIKNEATIEVMSSKGKIYADEAHFIVGKSSVVMDSSGITIKDR